MNLKEDPVKTNAGIHYKTDVTGFVPGNREDVLEAVNVMQSKPYQIIIQDGNGNYLLAGTQSYPLRLTAILQVGTKVSDPAGYQVHFTGQTILRARFINNPF
ncbi:MAG: hypothetical protein HQ522_00685 [Bacteroidetes bacterium]|nr:hypothetical protein [Bacteroidota bacterium]